MSAKLTPEEKAESLRRSARKWAAKNRDKRRAYHKKWRDKNKAYANQQNAEWRRKNRDRHIANATAWRKRNYGRRRWYSVKSKYGLTRDAYMALLQEQGGVCLLCLRPPKLNQFFVVDHDHSDGHIRGLVHMGCNAVLAGCFNDDPEQMRAAADRFLSRREKAA